MGFIEYGELVIINMSLQSLKQKCENSNRYKMLTPEQKKRYELEIKLAKRYYNNNIDLEEELEKNLPNNNNVIPYLLGKVDEIILDKIKFKQVFEGTGSGGIDIDNDIIPSGREHVLNYLKEKYGEESVISVGTYSTLKLKAAIKDVLRVYKIDYKDANRFTKDLESSLSFEDNYNTIIASDPWMKSFYEKHKEKIDIALKLVGKTRGMSKHAGGVVVSDKPVYEYIPVERVQGEVVTAYEESGQSQILDENSIVKFDILGISVLETVKNTIDLIDEEIYLIEDDDGIKKIVGESYLNKNLTS